MRKLNKSTHEMTFRQWREYERTRLIVEYPDADAEGIEMTMAGRTVGMWRDLLVAAAERDGVILRRQVLDALCFELARRDLDTISGQDISEEERNRRRLVATESAEETVRRVFRHVPHATQGWLAPTVRKRNGVKVYFPKLRKNVAR